MWITLRPFSEQLVHQHRLSRLEPANLAATSSVRSGNTVIRIHATSTMLKQINPIPPSHLTIVTRLFWGAVRSRVNLKMESRSLLNLFKHWWNMWILTIVNIWGEIERDHDCQKREGQLWLPALDEAVVSHQSPLCVPQSIQFVLQSDAGARLLLARFNQEFSFHFCWLWPAAAHLVATGKSPGRPGPGSWTTQSSPTCVEATQPGLRWQPLIIKH